MTSGFWIQFAGSAIAVAILVALAGWASIARAIPPLEIDQARRLMAEEFPDKSIDQLWIADDGKAALARSGDFGLVIYRVGDGLVGRQVPWSAIPKAVAGHLTLSFGDFAAPAIKVAFSGLGAAAYAHAAL